MVIDAARLQYDNRDLGSALERQSKLQAASGQGASRGAGVNSHIDKSSELYKQAQEFESIFVKMMLSEMRKSVEKSGMIDGGMAEDIFSDMLYDEYAQSMTKNAGFGLADQVYRQLNSYGAHTPDAN